ncbi:MAG: leucine-rich repeat domain-containing protein [Pseudomonadota bacterium]|nr:leucine-rich repeat domain-containing protein [Pseudomonadota bacterium]
MSVWTVPIGITEITQQYIKDNMPAGTTEVVIPEGVKSIGEGAFYDCTSLESVKIPNSVESIGGRAFLGCASLESIVIPVGVDSVGHSVFSNCTSLESVVIPESVKCIGEFAFHFCERLKSIVIPEGVERICGYAFSDCTSLESVKIPNSVVGIGAGAFRECTALNLIVLPDTLVDNRVRYGITENQTVIKHSDFNDWQCENGLEGKSYSDQVILFLYQLQNTESFKSTWNEVLNQYPEVGMNDLLKFADKKPMCLPEFFRSNGSCDVDEQMADAEKRNHCFEVSIDGNECPGFADALLQNLSLSDGASFFCTARDKHFRSHQFGESLEDTLIL